MIGSIRFTQLYIAQSATVLRNLLLDRTLLFHIETTNDVVSNPKRTA